jgi:hypothetical protein
LYQSDYQGYAGINIEVVGRNFDQSEFGGTTATLVRLNNDSGGVYGQTIASLNPYNVQSRSAHPLHGRSRRRIARLRLALSVALRMIAASHG